MAGRTASKQRKDSRPFLDTINQMLDDAVRAGRSFSLEEIERYEQAALHERESHNRVENMRPHRDLSNIVVNREPSIQTEREQRRREEIRPPLTQDAVTAARELGNILDEAQNANDLGRTLGRWVGR